MAETKSKCVKCGGSMEAGYLPGPGPYSLSMTGRWIKGRPVTTPRISARAPAGKALTITTWRCKDCGYLESFAK